MDNIWNKMDEIWKSLDSMFDNMWHSGTQYKVVKYTKTYQNDKLQCSKCGKQSLSQKHVVLKDERECLLNTCNHCGYESTSRTADSKQNYDLPSVDEAKMAHKQP